MSSSPAPVRTRRLNHAASSLIPVPPSILKTLRLLPLPPLRVLPVLASSGRHPSPYPDEPASVSGRNGGAQGEN
eukprot:750865-Hanusia_phi.AAC.3